MLRVGFGSSVSDILSVGGGFAGVETTGAINDFVRETVRYYPSPNEELIRVIVIHPGRFLLPE